MKSYGVAIVSLLLSIQNVIAQCDRGRSASFARWTGVAPDHATPVFVYSASGEEESLPGACLSRCRELEDCAAVVVMYSRGNCQGLAAIGDGRFRSDNDAAYFKKICLPLADECRHRWWALESTPGYHLHAEQQMKVVVNRTMQQCYESLLVPNREKLYRSAQWVGAETSFDAELIKISDAALGSCVLNGEDKFSEPESYRVSNYYTFYLENQCRHDYLKKIDRCSYEEYYNQTLKHVDFTIKNYTKDECKRACEIQDRFICRGFTWRTHRRYPEPGRGLCDLHSEDLVTTGSWLLRRTSGAVYYRRVICLNISVECVGEELVVTYEPRGSFRGRVYVPGRGEACGARADRTGRVQLTLPLNGDCDVNYAYGISNTPAGLVNRTMAYVMVMIQNNPIIQTAGDRWVRVGCSPGAQGSTLVNATVAVSDTVKGVGAEALLSGAPAAASAVYGARSAPLTMYVVRADDSRDEARAAAAALGEPLELRLETVTPPTDDAEILAYHLVASSRLGDSSVLLLDSRGCPTGQVDFPPFTRTWMNGIQRLSARFKAFRFPTSHVVRFALMVRFCDGKCPQVDCGVKSQLRAARQTNDTYYQWSDEVPAAVRPVPVQESPAGGGADVSVGSSVLAQGGAARCGGEGDALALELEMTVDNNKVLSADTLIKADHHSTFLEDGLGAGGESAVVCVHELLLVALALAWLAVQVLLLLGCCVLIKRYRNLAELSMQKDYHSFDNVGFDTVSTHRRVHWPDQNIDFIHS